MSVSRVQMVDPDTTPIVEVDGVRDAPPPPPRRGGTYDRASLYVVTLNVYGTQVFTWTASVEEAVEEAAEWAVDNAPGSFYEITESDLKEAAYDLGIPWPTDNEDAKQAVWEEVETDLMYTESGYLVSHETMIDEIDRGSDLYKKVWARSMRESYDHDWWEYFGDTKTPLTEAEGEDPGGTPEFFDVFLYEVDALDRLVFPQLGARQKVAFIDYFDRNKKRAVAEVVDTKDANKYIRSAKKKGPGFEFLN